MHWALNFLAVTSSFSRHSVSELGHRPGPRVRAVLLTYGHHSYKLQLSIYPINNMFILIQHFLGVCVPDAGPTTGSQWRLTDVAQPFLELPVQ